MYAYSYFSVTLLRGTCPMMDVLETRSMFFSFLCLVLRALKLPLQTH